MAKVKKRATTENNTAANLGFEAHLWAAADALRGSMDAAEYKHVVLGLIFVELGDVARLWRLFGDSLRPGPDARAMPRGLRLDAPGVLHHGMARGIERRAIVQDDRDRADFVRRLGALAQAGGVTRVEALPGSRRRAGAHALAVAGALAVRALGLPIAGVARGLRLSPTAVRARLARADGRAAERGLTPADLLRARPRNPR